MTSVHQSVLLKETIDSLDLGPDAVVLDATLGGGGHSREVCRRHPGVKIISIDQDEQAITNAKKKFKDSDCDITFVAENFRNLDTVLGGAQVDAIILDLGLSSDQLENSGRGFAFSRDEPLLMTMKHDQGGTSKMQVTAHDVVNSWSEESLADIIHGYGEERFARRIARAIVEARENSEEREIKTTKELVEIIAGAIPAKFRRGRIHFATKTFQAIRIAVNDELEALKEALGKGFDSLRLGGRMAVISFHSLEDRIVKRFYTAKVKEGKAKTMTARTEQNSSGSRKIILASKEEIKNNPRSRSAKLRVLMKIENNTNEQNKLQINKKNTERNTADAECEYLEQSSDGL